MPHGSTPRCSPPSPQTAAAPLPAGAPSPGPSPRSSCSSSSPSAPSWSPSASGCPAAGGVDPLPAVPGHLPDVQGRQGEHVRARALGDPGGDRAGLRGPPRPARRRALSDEQGEEFLQILGKKGDIASVTSNRMADGGFGGHSLSGVLNKKYFDRN